MPKKSIKTNPDNLIKVVKELQHAVKQLTVAQLVLASLVKNLLVWGES